MVITVVSRLGSVVGSIVGIRVGRANGVEIGVGIGVDVTISCVGVAVGIIVGIVVGYSGDSGLIGDVAVDVPRSQALILKTSNKLKTMNFLLILHTPR